MTEPDQPRLGAGRSRRSRAREERRERWAEQSNASGPGTKHIVLFIAMLAFLALISIFAWLFVPGMEQLLKGRFGEDGLPTGTRLTLATYRFWMFGPIGLLLLFLWIQRSSVHPQARHAGWRLVMSLGFLMVILMLLNGLFSLLLPLINMNASL